MDTHFEPTRPTSVPQRPPVHNAPAALQALTELHMPTAAHFRREHFPALDVDPAEWRLRVGGSVATPAIVLWASARVSGVISSETPSCASARLFSG